MDICVLNTKVLFDLHTNGCIYVTHSRWNSRLYLSLKRKINHTQKPKSLWTCSQGCFIISSAVHTSDTETVMITCVWQKIVYALFRKKSTLYIQAEFCFNVSIFLNATWQNLIIFIIMSIHSIISKEKKLWQNMTLQQRQVITKSHSITSLCQLCIFLKIVMTMLIKLLIFLTIN